MRSYDFGQSLDPFECGAEVDDLDGRFWALELYHQVLQFEIAVKEALGVDKINHPTDFDHDLLKVVLRSQRMIELLKLYLNSGSITS